MAIPNQIIISSSTNTVNVGNNNNSITVSSSFCNTLINVTQSTTNIVTVATPGPQGTTGAAGGGINTSSFATTGSNTFIGDQIITGSITSTTGFTGSLFGTSSWAQSASQTITSSYYKETDPVFTAVSGTFVLTSSFNAYTSSINTFTSSYNTGSFTGSFTGAFTGSLFGTAATASYYQETDPIFTAKSASLATTGSNNFNGNQTITGSLLQGLEGNIATGEYSHAEGSITKAIGNYSHAEGDFTQAKGDYSHAEGQETIASGSYSHAEGYQTIALGDRQHVTGQYNFVSPVQSAFIVGNGTDNSNRSNLIYAHDSTVEITGSLEVNGGITGSLFGTSSWANNSTSASFSLTASYINNLSQSIIITGSTQGNVTTLSIASNTASLNLNLGNFFTLQLVSGSNTYINPSNIKPGQSSVLQLSTTGSATVSFPSTVKQPSGSAYTPTTTTGTDILTFVSFDSSNLYLVSVKNLI
jgi:hypothetical protein